MFSINTRWIIAMLLGSWTIWATDIYGESEHRIWSAGVVLGLAYEGARFGDDNPVSHHEIGITIGGQLWTPTESPTIVIECTWHLNKMDNPHFPEWQYGFRALSLEVGIDNEMARAHLRPSAGLVYRSWSSTTPPGYLEMNKEVDIGPVLGLAAGLGPKPSRRGLQAAPELKLLLSPGILWPSTWMVALQVPLRGNLTDDPLQGTR